MTARNKTQPVPPTIFISPIFRSKMRSGFICKDKRTTRVSHGLKSPKTDNRLKHPSDHLNTTPSRSQILLILTIFIHSRLEVFSCMVDKVLETANIAMIELQSFLTASLKSPSLSLKKGWQIQDKCSEAGDKMYLPSDGQTYRGRIGDRQTAHNQPLLSFPLEEV